MNAREQYDDIREAEAVADGTAAVFYDPDEITPGVLFYWSIAELANKINMPEMPQSLTSMAPFAH